MDEARERAVEIVRGFKLGLFETEQEGDDALAELQRLVPDPNVSALLFHPRRHKLSADLPEAERTAEKIVELAFQYQPFAL